MDQRRFLAFFAASMLIFMGWSLVVQTFFPPPEVVQVEEPAADGDPAPGDPADEPADPDAPAQPPDAAADAPDTATPDADAADQDHPPAAETDVEPQWFTLGSMKPGDAFPLVVTLNNRGAAVENVELVARNAKGRFRYRDLDDDSGYLGYLALSAVEGGGCRVESVIPGSPAADAGLQPGDILLSIDEEPLAAPRDLGNWLRRSSKPGQEVTLNVQPATGGQPTPVAATLAARPLSVIAPEYQRLPDDTLLEHQHSFLLDFDRLGDVAVRPGEQQIAGARSLRDEHWQGRYIENGSVNGVEFTFQLPATGGADASHMLEVVKRYWLKPRAADEAAADGAAGYDLTLELEFRNSGPSATKLAYRLDGPTGLPKEGWWYANKIHPSHFFTSLGARDVIWATPNSGLEFLGNRAIIKGAEDKKGTELTPLFTAGQPAPFRFAGVDAQYFSAVMMPEAGEGLAPVLLKDAYGLPVTDAQFIGDDPGRYKNSNITFRLVSGLHELDGGETLKQRFTVFAGPKDPELLARYDLDGIISYGWFGAVSRLLLQVLHGLYWLTGGYSYGLAIVLLTLLVRCCLMPLGLKAARSAKKMQELAPEVKKIKEKYPDNLEQQWKAQQELFKKHNASQFGGCLPMLLQLPIFLGLYRGLATDIELRQAPLIPGMDWCSNLSGPDKLFYWEPYLWQSLGGEMGWLGPYFNLLPVITVVLFYVHQKLFTPPATDDQQKQMQQVMSFMMIFFCVMFFKVPAGLCIYFITSSLWGLGERLLLKKNGSPATVAETDRQVSPAADASAARAKTQRTERRKELARKKQKKR